MQLHLFRGSAIVWQRQCSAACDISGKPCLPACSSRFPACLSYILWPAVLLPSLVCGRDGARGRAGQAGGGPRQPCRCGQLLSAAQPRWQHACMWPLSLSRCQLGGSWVSLLPRAQQACLLWSSGFASQSAHCCRWCRMKPSSPTRSALRCGTFQPALPAAVCIKLLLLGPLDLPAAPC